MADLQRVLDKAVLGLFSPTSYASTFLTTIFCSLKIRWDPNFRTAWTNGLVMGINPDWFLTLSERMRITLLSHELWHVAYLHGPRRGVREPRLWNMACDYAINLMLLEHGYHFDMDKTTGKRMGLIDRRFANMSAEQIYEILEREQTTIDLPFDLDFDNTDPEDGTELPPETLNQVVAVLTRAALASEMNAAEAGTLPAEVTSMMATLLRPRVKWGNKFDKWFTDRFNMSYTWTRPNRRYEGIYLPAKDSDHGLAHLIYAIDCSCSLTDKQLLVINSALKEFKDKFNPEQMTIVSFDTRIHDRWEFSADDDISSLEIHGRGGTDMREVFELVKKERPAALVMFSDMECRIPEKVRGVEVLWICLDNSWWVPPYGQVIHIDSTLDL